jgi:L-alanine-DL-glutamate epimerase-like enolase superfamily enzyme
MKISARIEEWAPRLPMAITDYSWDTYEVLVVEITEGPFRGRGEAAGVYYRAETARSMSAQIDAIRPQLSAGVTRLGLLELLPSGGARNAVDAALWDLEACRSGIPVWKLAGSRAPEPIPTMLTIYAYDPATMANCALEMTAARSIKLKLTGHDDAERVRAVRHARPDVWLAVDANQAFDTASLEALMPTLVEARVGLIEQPFPIGREGDLDGLNSPIPIAADESVQDASDLHKIVGRVAVVNIKLDKCGGLTSGLQIARQASEMGLDLMVGCMWGTSLSIAPGYLLGQQCRYVDLDAAYSLVADRTPGVRYENGTVSCPTKVWGSPAPRPDRERKTVA